MAASSRASGPAANTADYFDRILTRLTTIGALYLCVVCLLPEILIANYNVPFYFGGTSLMIIVSVTMDTVTQVQSHLLAHQYEGLIRKSRTTRQRARRGEADPARDRRAPGKGTQAKRLQDAYGVSADRDRGHAKRSEVAAGTPKSGCQAKAIMDVRARWCRTTSSSAMLAGRVKPAGLRARLHPGRVPPHRRAGGGAGPRCWHELDTASWTR